MLMALAYFFREMAKHPAKFIEACKRSKVDTDELAKQVRENMLSRAQQTVLLLSCALQWLQDHKTELAETQIAFGMRLQV